MATIESMKSYTLGNSAIINYQNYFISVIFNLLFRNFSNFLASFKSLLLNDFLQIFKVSLYTFLYFSIIKNYLFCFHFLRSKKVFYKRPKFENLNS